VKFDQVKKLKSEAFRRLTGIKRPTFDKMIEILTEAEIKQKVHGGKPNLLGIENRLLMTLEYLREYRTYFHVSQSYGISESACFRNIRWVEDVLIKSRIFSLPGRKALAKSDVEYETILIDVAESPIERPKKNNGFSIQAKKSDTR
jgi:hypothetical protein